MELAGLVLPEGDHLREFQGVYGVYHQPRVVICPTTNRTTTIPTPLRVV